MKKFKGAYLLLVPDEVMFIISDVLKEYEEDVLVFRPELFKSVYKDILNECSVTNVTVEADGCLGQE